MLEGFCEVNIKTSRTERRYNRRHMSEMYRPLGRMEKERFKRLNEPRAWEYQVLSQEELAWNRSRLERNYRQEQPVVNITAGGILLLAFLELLNCLSNPDGSGIEGEGK